MVRETRFSFEDGMNVDFPRSRDTFDDDDELDEFFGGDPHPVKTPHRSRREETRARPEARRPDRRHLAGADWMAPDPGRDDPAKGSGSEAAKARQEQPDDQSARP